MAHDCHLKKHLNSHINNFNASFHQNKRDYRKQLFVSQECEHFNNRLVSVVYQDNVFILHGSSVNYKSR